MKNAITFFIVSFIVSSCAILDENKERKESIYTQYINNKNLESQKKISRFRFQGWSSLDDEHLIVTTSFSKHYLIELVNFCNDLRFTQTILIHNSGSILHAKFDSISVPNNRAPQCRIDSIYRITKKQADELSALKVESKIEKS